MPRGEYIPEEGMHIPPMVRRPKVPYEILPTTVGVDNAYVGATIAPDAALLDIEQRATQPGLSKFVIEAGITQRMREILVLLGYDTNDQHIQRTPERVAQVLLEFHRNGKEEDVQKLLDVSFDESHDSLVMVGPIRIVSLCAHHMLPVTGDAWVGYLPNARVCGISKLARVAHHYARQLTVQEKLTDQVVDALMEYLDPMGSMCVIKAVHGCMSIRGVGEPNALTTTSSVRGVFLKDADARAEFLSLMSR